MFTPAQLLHKWHEQRPSNESDLDSSATGRLGECIKRGGPAADIFVYKYGWVAF
jgi:hypothetical protein